MKNVAPIPGRKVRGSATGKPIMAALDLFGRRGMLRILWELRDGQAMTFRALAAAADLPPGTLNARLKEMREAGLLATEGGYSLTPLAFGLQVALEPLLVWSQDWAKAMPRPPSP